MKPTCLALLALACPLFVSTPAVAGQITGGYLDILSAEAVGELRPQRYDAYRTRDGNDVFVGTQQLERQTLLAAGLGVRFVFAMSNGLRFSGEGSLQGGRLVGNPAAAVAESAVLRGELMMGLGWQVCLGPLVLHTAGIWGADYASLSFAPSPGGTAALSLAAAASAPGATPLSEDITLKRWGLRLGAQAGAHLQVSKLAALYSDVTFDYDGQWRTRFGIAFGQPGPR